MSKNIPQIQKYMTTVPTTIDIEQSLSEAETMMKEMQIRHLPVMASGELLGIITESDINLIKTFRGVNLDMEKVVHAYTPHPIMVSITEPLDKVCGMMADKKIGSVMVVDNKKLVGIFTWIDALMVITELFETRLKK